MLPRTNKIKYIRTKSSEGKSYKFSKEKTTRKGREIFHMPGLVDLFSVFFREINRLGGN